jgi:hypothetical protein
MLTKYSNLPIIAIDDSLANEFSVNLMPVQSFANDVIPKNYKYLHLILLNDVTERQYYDQIYPHVKPTDSPEFLIDLISFRVITVVMIDIL